MKQNLDDYPVSALWYTLVASASLMAGGVAMAVAWGHSISQAIIHAHG